MAKKKHPKSWETMERIERYCKANNRQSQTWVYNGKRYFFEEDANSRPEGASLEECKVIFGEINVMTGSKTAKKVGNFRIEANGEISKGRFGFKELGKGTKKK
jgi:hypothetical protein